ncbi:General stress protein Gls20 [Bombilactobacillus mellis]|uniref:Stress response regulator gls24 homolog n=1 Tax=Bombilactobacillus mellis TaxID=1218508 RepID=A0A0F4KQP5_9LACO|nr:Asp23/Gls24 family envelope stress response protein [Bombilactobacillus mellis]KJY48967.1 General stress protein Gls20 [Bombilactobacillus mellis]MCX0279499.1 Asp23/Gls24 family envelope stress response protein [Bombilactobacillus mellis]
MAKENEKAQGNSQSEIKGELTYDQKVVQKIIGMALSDIDGLLTVDGGFFSNLTDKLVNNDDVTSGINVEVGKKQVAVDVDIVAEYGTNISKLYDQIKDKIYQRVMHMTGLEVVEVNVNVVDVKTKAEHEKDSTSLQDKISHATDNIGKNAKQEGKKAQDKMQEKTSSNNRVK